MLLVTTVDWCGLVWFGLAWRHTTGVHVHPAEGSIIEVSTVLKAADMHISITTRTDKTDIASVYSMILLRTAAETQHTTRTLKYQGHAVLRYDNMIISLARTHASFKREAVY